MVTKAPKFPKFALWGACSRCGQRTPYGELQREKLTGLLMCTVPRGKPRACFDPWPDVLDFDVKPDHSIEPPPEPLPARWLLDDIFSAGTFTPVTGANALGTGTSAGWAQAPKPAPDDATRLNAFLRTQFQTKGTADFTGYRGSLNPNQDRQSVVAINSLAYDGTFVPSSSARTVTPPDPVAELKAVGAEAGTGTPLAAPPWSVVKNI